MTRLRCNPPKFASPGGYIWRHGCTAEKPCGRRYGAHCPKRHGGGVVTTEFKSRAGQRTVGIPMPLVQALQRHQERQAVERAGVAELWHDEGWVFTNQVGKAVHPTVDHEVWKSLLKRAKVRDAWCTTRGTRRRQCCWC